MRLYFPYLNKDIPLGEDAPTVLVLENKRVFRQTLLGFESETVDESLTFSKNYEPFEFRKKGWFLPDPLDVDLENKKLMQKIYRWLEEAANGEFCTELGELREALVCFGDKLAGFCDFDCGYQFDIEAAAIIKLLQFRIDREKVGPAEALLTFMRQTAKYLKTEIFVTANLHLYFEKEELESFFETLALDHIRLLCLEQTLPETSGELYIIDKDLCVIDKGVDRDYN